MKLILSRLAFLAAALAVALPSAAVADDNCALHRVASVDMGTDAQGDVTIPLGINGKSFNMIVDTGGFGSIVTASTAKALGLEQHYSPLQAQFFGGIRLDHKVTASQLALGTMTPAKKYWDFFVVPDGVFPPGVGGLLGPELLMVFDVDFDFANGKLNLIDPNHCKGRVVYWTQDSGSVARIPMRLDQVGHISLTYQLDGHDIKALLDTGAPVSYLSFDTAKDIFNIDPKSADLKPAAGWENFPHAVRYPFKSMTIEPLSVTNPDVILVPDDESKMSAVGRIHALLGMTVIRSLHLYIAYQEQMLYVTPASAH